MKIVLQRVSKAVVDILDHQYRAEIGPGYVILLGITHEDDSRHADVLIDKLLKLRIWPDENGKMNHDLSSVQGDILVISQFTLYADMKKGNRPSYIEAARPDHAEALYKAFVAKLGMVYGGTIQEGIFGADMKVSLTNDGPVTLILDSTVWQHKIK